MKRLSLLAIALCASAAPVHAQSAPTSGDDAAIERLIAPSLEALKAGKARQAVDAFLGTNPMISGKASEMAYLSSQIDSTFGLYGPISACQLAETRNIGAWVEQRLYHCQHPALVTRWIFLSVKGSKGWGAANMSFDDKVAEALGG